MGRLQIVTILLICFMLILAGCAGPLEPEEQKTAQEEVLKELKIEAINVYRPPNFGFSRVEVVVNYNEYTVPRTTYFVELRAEFEDGYKLGILGVETVTWSNIAPTPFSIGDAQTLRFEGSQTARFFHDLEAEQLKPISERRDVRFSVVVRK